jgi:dTDP-4-amino-4,6-dideoxygalactose transaminase
MKVDFLNVLQTNLDVKDEIFEAIQRVVESGVYIGGSEVSEFECDYSKYVSSSYCVGVGNGLDAIRLSLQAIGVGPGDEVIVPAHTFIATWLAVNQCGAEAVPIEPEAHGYNIDPLKLEEKINKKTKAIIVVHLYGVPANLPEILRIARRNGVRVVEDAAQAHGALIDGQRIGAHSDAVAWSFYPGKNLGGIGDAGAVTTNDKKIAEKIRCIANYGSTSKYEHIEIGFNSRLDPIQAAVLKVKLRYLEGWNTKRKAVAEYYISELGDKYIPWKKHDAMKGSVWHIFPIETRKRDELKQVLADNGISTLVHYPKPPHLQTAYKDQFLTTSLPLTEFKCSRLLSLPIGPYMSNESVDHVVKVLNGFES